MKMKQTSNPIYLSLALLVALLPLADAADGPSVNSQDQAVEATVQHGLGHKLLYYIPNRALDLMDMLRLRLRVGPGLSAGVRATERLAFFGGQHKTAYAGLPGPRAPKKFVSPVGLESYKGLVFAGVDATDDTDHPPGYSQTEMTIGVQALVVGVDAGTDFVEIADFITGLILIDLRKDDL